MPKLDRRSENHAHVAKSSVCSPGDPSLRDISLELAPPLRHFHERFEEGLTEVGALRLDTPGALAGSWLQLDM